VVNGKKDNVVGVMIAYISKELRFHIIEIDHPNEVLKKIKRVVDKVKVTQVMKLEKELVCLNPLSCYTLFWSPQ
jgi:hypothetical protein